MRFETAPEGVDLPTMGGRVRRCSGLRLWLWVGAAVVFGCGTDGNDPEDGLDGGAGLVADAAAPASGGAPAGGGAPASGGSPGSAGANDILACDTVEADATEFVEANKACSTAGDCLEAFLLCFAREEACCAVYLNRNYDRIALALLADRLGSCLGPCTCCGTTSPPPACVAGRCGPGSG